MAPLVAKNLFELLAKLPQNGLGARVAPITWALKGSPNSYYLITASHLRFQPRVDGSSFPLRLSDDGSKKLLPADANYMKAQEEKRKVAREQANAVGGAVVERRRISALRTDEELDEFLVDEQRNVMRPLGRAWGLVRFHGEPSHKFGLEPIPVDKHKFKYPWRLVTDEEEVSMSSLRAWMPKAGQEIRGRRR